MTLCGCRQRTMPHTRHRRIFATAAFGLLLGPMNAHAAAAVAPNKVMTLSRADRCSFESVRPEVDTLSESWRNNAATTRVIVNRPFEEVVHSGVAGQISAFLAALEVVASPSAVPQLAAQAEKAFIRPCRADGYRMKERLLRALDKTWDTGDPSPGVKMILRVVKKLEFSATAFAARWSDHARIALANPVKTLQYVQNVVVARNDGAPDIVGIGEMHFHDVGKFRTRGQVAPEASRQGMGGCAKFHGAGSDTLSDGAGGDRKDCGGLNRPPLPIPATTGNGGQ